MNGREVAMGGWRVRRTVAAVAAAILVAGAGACEPTATPDGSPGPSSPPNGLATPTPEGRAVGLLWEQVGSPVGRGSGTGELGFRGVTGPAGLLVIGAGGEPERPDTHAWLTDDGLRWRTVDPPFPELAMLPNVLYATPRDYVAVTPDVDMTFRVRASTTGSDWRSLGSFSGLDDISAVATLRTTHLLCGHGPDGTNCARSADDGGRWAIVPGPAGGSVDSIAVVGGRFLACGRDAQGWTLWDSIDGIDWRGLPADRALSSIAGGWASGIVAGARGVVLAGSMQVTDRRRGDHPTGAIWSSPDGRAWSWGGLADVAATSFTVTPVGQAYLAVGTTLRDASALPAEILLSVDGLRWRPEEPPTELPLDVVGAYDAFVLVQEQPEDASNAPRWFRGVLASVDEPWPVPQPLPTATPVPVPPDEPPGPAVRWGDPLDVGRGVVSDVAAFGGGFVAVGRRSDDEGAGAAIWRSEDGVAWRRLPDDPVFAGARLDAVLAAGDRLVVAGAVAAPGPNDLVLSAGFWWSTEGTTWHRAAGNAGRDLGGLPTDEPDPGVHALAEGPDGLVAVGSTIRGGRVWTSADGRSWALAASFDGWPWGVAWRQGYVAVGSVGLFSREGRLWTSADGRAWSEAMGAIDGRELTAVAASDDLMLATADGPGAWVSAGGRWAWAPDQPGLESGSFADVAALPGGFIAVGLAPCGAGETTCPTAWTSAAGMRWTPIVRAPTAAGAAFEAVAAGAGVVVAIENGPSETIRAWSGRVGG